MNKLGDDSAVAKRMGPDIGPIADGGGDGPTSKEVLPDADIVGLLSDRYRSKGRRVLSFLRAIPNVSWTDRGELKVGERVHRGSHIVDLVSKVVKPARKGDVEPMGWRAFMSVLKSSNAPTDLMSASAQRAYNTASLFGSEEGYNDDPGLSAASIVRGRKLRRKKASVSRRSQSFSPAGKWRHL